ncbi:hypothetical protein [Weissella muntiaci]|nr:hypothetical protein [Weissella muntiaci]
MDKKGKREVAKGVAAEYLTFIAASGVDESSFEMRYEGADI